MGSHIRRRGAEGTAKHPMKIRHRRESAMIGQIENRHPAVERRTEHLVRAPQASLVDFVDKGAVVLGQQGLDISRRDAELACEHRKREIRIDEPAIDLPPDREHACSAQPPVVGNFRDLPGSTDGQHRQISDVPRDHALEVDQKRLAFGLHDRQIFDQVPQCPGVGRDRFCEGAVGIGDHRHEGISRQRQREAATAVAQREGRRIVAGKQHG